MKETGIKQLKEKAKLLEPTVRIGKNGLTESAVGEIKKQLKKRGIIKVKMLRNFIEGRKKKEVAQQVAEQTESELVDSIGFVLVLKRKN